MPHASHHAVPSPLRSQRGVRMPSLDCLECHETIWLEPVECFEGAIIRCKHCRHDAWLAREYDTRRNELVWTLMDPESDLPPDDDTY